MNRIRRPYGRKRAAGSVIVTAGLLVGLAVPALAGTASAATGPVPSPSPSPAPPHQAASVAAAAPHVPMQTASSQAKRTRQAVTVDSMTSQTSTTVANPDGTFTTTTSVLPVRVDQHGAWVPVDATLHRDADGSYRPAATPSVVALSAGGSGPLAVLTSPSGDNLSVTFPFPLPAPAVSGATATYRNVLPGVDLVATVTDQGGFSDVLVVHDAAAAANPALRELRIGTAARGLSLRADAHGNLMATGADGRAEFVAPTPRMWDSAAAAGPGQSNAARNTAGLSAEHVTDIGVRIVGGALLLTPAQRMLTASSTHYPVYIDPVINPASSGTAGYVETQSGTGSDGSDCGYTKNWNNASTAPLGIGYQNYPGSTCQGIYRSYYQINTTNLNSSMHVSSATLLTAEQWASDLNCSHTWPVQLNWTVGIDQNTDGHNQPRVLGTFQTMRPKSAAVGCGTQDVNFDVTSLMQQATVGNWATFTFGLFGDEAIQPEGDCSGSYNCGFMRFNDNPSVTTVFDIAPNPPANPGTTPAPQNPNTQGCNSAGPYGWIGRTDLGAGNGSSVTLDATVTSNIVGEKVQARWTVWDNSAPNNPVGSNVVASPDSVMVASGTTVDIPIGVALKDGHQYGIRAWAYDGILQSPTASGDCHFNVDLTPPTVPRVNSAAFPASGTGTSPSVGASGDFTVSSTDPVPTGCVSACVASGVAKYEYSFNTPIPANNASSVAPGAAIHLQAATQWGTNILYVDAVDAAGNRSQVAQYDFYVKWNPNIKVTPGDVTGDGVPDLLATNTAGDLLVYPGNTDPALTPAKAGTAATSPEPGFGWNTFQITHRGSMSQQSVDDLFAHKGGNMYLYGNSGGTAPQFANTASIFPITKPGCAATADNAGNCATYSSGSWSAVTQILAPGDLYQGLSGDNGLPSLLTVENDQLWAYQGGFGGSLQNPVLLGGSGWKKMTLIAPGMVGGQLSLWARDTSNGALYSYPLKLDANGLPVSLGPATGTGSTGTSIGLTLMAGTYPTLASPGDLTGSGFPGLYAEDTSGNLWFYPGQSTSGGASPLAGTRQLVGAVNNAAAQWTLTDGSGTAAADATGNGHDGTLTGGVSWAAGTARGTVASFNGSSGAITTSKPVVNTGGDFSVSGWAYLTKLGNWADVATQDGNSISGFYLQYSAADNTWALSRNASDSPSSVMRAVASSPPTLNTWTHLVGTYHAATGQLDLYVNGKLEGTAVDTTPFATPGPFAIGRGKWNGSLTDWFPGQISDVEAFNYTLSPGEVTALDQGQLPVTQLS